jgi:D-sedoheptulose 7-phosphate isomerase
MMTPLQLYQQTIQRDGLILLAGCGGFAAHAQHMAAELVVRYKKHRAPVRAIALGCNAAIWSAAVNDFGADTPLAREALALARRGDLMVIYSTSGRSPMLLRLAEQMAGRGVDILAWCPADSPLADYATVRAGTGDQETATVTDHLICEHLDL